MKAKWFFATLLITIATASISQKAMAHCQVPCGIFADQLRFEAMLEDQTTVAKANVQMAKLLKGNTPVAVNQATRWILTKEDHCKNIMETVAQYFMAQRIKPDAENYEKTLVAAHNVMRAAMKAKQDPSAEVAEALKASILEFYQAYEGKAFEAHSH